MSKDLDTACEYVEPYECRLCSSRRKDAESMLVNGFNPRSGRYARNGHRYLRDWHIVLCSSKMRIFKEFYECRLCSKRRKDADSMLVNGFNPRRGRYARNGLLSPAAARHANISMHFAHG
jgi:hypothetical protein